MTAEQEERSQRGLSFHSSRSLYDDPPKLGEYEDVPDQQQQLLKPA